jgi:outer membrane biogenesis lipoprotein LolB
MKLIFTLLAVAMLTGCAAYDELMRITNSNYSGQAGNYNQRHYNRNSQSDRYQQGYRAGYYDSRNPGYY